jgi:hypothetical protein
VRILVLQYRAYIYSSPTVVDLDGDGMLEVSMQQPQCATVATVVTQSGLCNAACSREHPCHCCCTPASPIPLAVRGAKHTHMRPDNHASRPGRLRRLSNQHYSGACRATCGACR